MAGLEDEVPRQAIEWDCKSLNGSPGEAMEYSVVCEQATLVYE
jgi:hypothetical protein